MRWLLLQYGALAVGMLAMGVVHTRYGADADGLVSVLVPTGWGATNVVVTVTRGG